MPQLARCTNHRSSMEHQDEMTTSSSISHLFQPGWLHLLSALIHVLPLLVVSVLLSFWLQSFWLQLPHPSGRAIVEALVTSFDPFLCTGKSSSNSEQQMHLSSAVTNSFHTSGTNSEYHLQAITQEGSAWMHPIFQILVSTSSSPPIPESTAKPARANK